MAAQTLDQILSGLQSVYQPQLDSVAAQQAALPAQFQAQTQGVEASKNNAFDSILSQARQRGTGVAFGGIPLSEQAQYTASTYAPALANLQTSQNNQQQSLVDAINSINANKFSTANSMYQFGVNQDFQQQQLAEQAREANQTAAGNAASSASSFNPTLGGATSPTTSATGSNAKTYSNGKSLQDAYNSVQQLMQSRNTPLIAQTYQAIAAAASKGSQYDQAKLNLLQQLYGNSLAKNGIGAGQNAAAARF